MTEPGARNPVVRLAGVGKSFDASGTITEALRDINLDAQNNAPPCFAVQLVWAVTPIDVASLPHLAIFDAYTLYNVEGSRQGRKWYGLRLGFFSDPNSATQVAHYVRSDYQAVAVVPVAIKERDNARGGTRGPVVAARLGGRRTAEAAGRCSPAGYRPRWFRIVAGRPARAGETRCGRHGLARRTARACDGRRRRAEAGA